MPTRHAERFARSVDPDLSWSVLFAKARMTGFYTTHLYKHFQKPYLMINCVHFKSHLGNVFKTCLFDNMI